MQLRYRYRLEPTPKQQAALACAFGCARVVFNDALAAREQARRDAKPYIDDAELSKALTRAKGTTERTWLSDVSAVVLQQALADLNTAYRNFFHSLSGKRRGPRMGPPRFRSRRDTRQTIRFTRNARFAITPGGRLRLPKIGELRVRWSRNLPGEPSSVTVILDSTGRYFASFVVDVESNPLPHTDTEVGIDLGLSSFAVLSDGTTIANPRFLRNAERRLAKAQKSLSRKEKGSKNREKARIRVAKVHARVSDARRDFAHQLSTKIVRENQAIYLEDLCVAALAHTRLAKSVHDASWSLFTTMLTEKAARYGRDIVRIDRWFPSTRMCSACGTVDTAKPLAIRSWDCSRCGTSHDRDLNAARNILAAGRAERLNASHAGGRHSTGVGGAHVRPHPGVAAREEAGTHRSHASTCA
ncbi:RNA-guided endonuclease InsQ/TnpB family protein [Nocardia acididurans]|uniref:RNA-guided endonuclease InsQ/TnpB family protein n=1 Tax=Nocardia acididurans TaxID=2802282 RepID=UPI0027DD2B9C|nr:RNA-guided endonuclease TnpB family protein [Nocardia acididurans]